LLVNLLVNFLETFIIKETGDGTIW
jgi:hypothetical protein